MADLRSYVFLDSLQGQHAAFLGTVKSAGAASIKEAGYDIKADVAAHGITFLLE